jgi:uncharacterized membrane protein YeaQ/YmgE (transglycosylase-associated protein family)
MVSGLAEPRDKENIGQPARKNKPHFKIQIDYAGAPCGTILPGGAAMSYLAWAILGLIAGFIASKIVNKTGAGLFLDLTLGIVGEFVGGWLFSVFGGSGVTGFNLYSLLVSVVGAIVILVLYHALSRA